MMESLQGKKRSSKITDKELGILQWFHIGEHEKVVETLNDLKKLRIKNLRTGVSWADYYTPVIIYDNLSRQGVEQNLDWLLSQHDPKDIWVELADTRNIFALQKVVSRSILVYHLAGQVAVTTSLEDPTSDFDINIKGTFYLLEAIRNSPHQPPLIYTSTNKVYGNLSDLEFEKLGSRYVPTDDRIKNHGIDESQTLNFYSPYGCVKQSRR